MSESQFNTTSPWGTLKATGLTAASLKLINLLPVTGISRKLAFVLRKPVKMGKQAIYDREIWNLRLRLSARGNLTEQRWLTMPSFHDLPERCALAQALGKDSVFLDIGANAGFYTFWALSLRQPGLRALVVEPAPVMLERMRFNLATNGLDEAVTIFPCAVTPEPYEVVIDQHDVNIGQSAVRTEGSGLKVPGRPVFELLEEAGVHKVDAMKIDIEGFEVPVLEAFYATAPRSLWPKLVIGEIVGPDGSALKSLLVSKGYTVQHSTKMNGILVLEDS